MNLEKLLKNLKYTSIVGTLLLTSSCGRIGSLPWKTLNTSFLNPLKLGTHNKNEKRGQVYTLKAGPIDITHARIVADRTKKMQQFFYTELLTKQTKVSFEIAQMPRYSAEIDYPDNWDDLSEENKRDLAKEASIDLGAYFAYIDSIWHEVWTWCGGRSFSLFCEKPSAFSCEDNVSNAIGAYVAKTALRDKTRTFNQAVTLALNNELERLCIQPREIAIKNSYKTKNQKHFDIGLDDGLITPWYASDTESDYKKIEDYPAPTLHDQALKNFSIEWNLKPYSGPGRKALTYIGKNPKEKINSKELFDIVYQIKQESIRSKL